MISTGKTYHRDSAVAVSAGSWRHDIGPPKGRFETKKNHDELERKVQIPSYGDEFVAIELRFIVEQHTYEDTVVCPSLDNSLKRIFFVRHPLRKAGCIDSRRTREISVVVENSHQMR